MSVLFGLLNLKWIFSIFAIVNAIPRRANEPWSVVLCKFAEVCLFHLTSNKITRYLAAGL